MKYRIVRNMEGIYSAEHHLVFEGYTTWDKIQEVDSDKELIYVQSRLMNYIKSVHNQPKVKEIINEIEV